MNIGYLLLTIHRRVLQHSQDPLVGWGGGRIRAVDFLRKISEKILPLDIRFKG